jgi:acetyl-CoA carboxylase biotin carboxyl carrier protein
MVHDTDIVELTLNSKKFKLAVKKKEALEAAEPTIVHMQAAPAGYAPVPAPPAPGAAPAAAATAPAAAPAAAAPAAPAGPAEGTVEIASPMAGTFYCSPAPGEPPFCRVGDRVTKGQVVGIIEAMKLMNEIESEVSGTIVSLVAENGAAVTPGSALVLIRP